MSGTEFEYATAPQSDASRQEDAVMKAKWSVHAGVVLMFAGVVPPAGAQTYGGSATGVVVTVPATGTTIRAATGTLSIAGGGAHAALLVGDVPGSATGGVVSLAAGTLHSAVVGLAATGGGASMSNVNLGVSGNQISVDFLMARGTASCGPAAAGTSQLQNLVINGQSVTVTGNPNQTVTLSNGTVIINRQVSSIGASSAELTVDALNVTTRDPVTQQELANVVLGSVNAQIDCSGGSSPNETWTTGGGWILLPSTFKGTFGVSGGVETAGSVRGHLVYRDHGTDFRVKDTIIDSVIPGCTTTIHGFDRNGPDEVEFTVTVSDSGETGDSFTIQASGAGVPGGAYTATGTLQGGNIKVHDQACP
jgi:hypothetical protein